MIKAIAVDMDGTFLDSKSNYDRERFENIYQELVTRDIKFIVASGNQYYQIKSFFPGKADYIIYVSENGAIIGDKGRLKSISEFSSELIQQIINDLVSVEGDLEFVLCGVKSAYLLKESSQRFKDFAKKYYYELLEVDSFDTLPEDTFVKVALDVEIEKTASIVNQLNHKFTDEILAVSSGHGSIDIIIPGITKGSTISKILEKLKIQSNELLAFGDANNDLEMLALTENSFAMTNGNTEVKQVATYEAPSNDESGVLIIIEKYLNA